MRRHIYVGLLDARLQWLQGGIVVYDVVEFYGQLFHIYPIAKIGNYTVVEITNFDTKFPMKRLYRWFKRNDIPGVVGPFTLNQLAAAYPDFVNEHFRDDQGNLVPKRQIAGDPHPVIQAQFEYNPTAEELAVDEILNESDELE